MSAAAGSSDDGDKDQLSRKELVARYMEVYTEDVRKDHASASVGVEPDVANALAVASAADGSGSGGATVMAPLLTPLGSGRVQFGKRNGTGAQLAPSYMTVDIDPSAEGPVNGGRSFVDVISKRLDYYTPLPWMPFIHSEYKVIDFEFAQEDETSGLEEYLMKAMPHQRGSTLTPTAFKPIVLAKPRSVLAAKMGLSDHSGYSFMPLQIELTACSSTLPIAMKLVMVTPVPGMDGLFRKWHSVASIGASDATKRRGGGSGSKSDDDIVSVDDVITDGYLITPMTTTVNETDAMLYTAAPEHKVNSVPFSRWITCDFKSLRTDFERVPVDQVFESLSAYALTCPRISDTAKSNGDFAIGVEHGRDTPLWFALNNVEEIFKRTVYYCKTKQLNPANYLKFFTDSSSRTLLYLVKDVIDEFINELEVKYPKRKYLAALGDSVGLAVVLSPQNTKSGWSMLAEEAGKRKLYAAGTDDNSARVYLKARMFYHVYKASQFDQAQVARL
jgi:hypothetical protein